MAKLFVTGINLNKNELQNARIQNLSSNPSSPVAGQIYYNTSTNVLYFYNGSEWIPASGSTEVIQDVIGSAVLGGTGLTATYNDGAGTTTIDLDNTSVTAGSYGSSTEIPTFTVDAQGRLTAAGTADVATQLSLDLNGTVIGSIDLLTDALGFSAGEGIDINSSNPIGSFEISAELATSANRGIASFDSTDFTVTDGAVTLNAERVEDIISSTIHGGTGIDATYNDGAGTVTIDIDSTVATLSGTQTLTNKTFGNGTVLDANLDADNNKIENLSDPVNPQDAANKRYVDNAVSGLDWKTAVNLIATSNIADITDLASVTIDSHPVDVDQIGYRILLTAQSTDSQNGIYEVVAGGVGGTITLTRTADADAYTELVGAAIFVMEGTQYGSTSWVQSNHYLTDFTNQEWVQFSGAGTYTAGDGISLVGNEFTVHLDSDSLVKSASGLKVNYHTESGLDNDSGLFVKLGTGLVFDGSGQITNNTNAGYGVRKYAQQIGDGSATSIYVEHGFGTRSVTVQVFETGTPYAQVEADVEHTDNSGVTIKFAVAPTSSQYEVVIVG